MRSALKLTVWLCPRVILVAIVLSSAADASAGGRWRLRANRRVDRAAWRYNDAHYSYPRSNYDQQRDYLNARYPKYTGGFHSRYFDTLGVPSGDVGLRGNSLYLMPW